VATILLTFIFVYFPLLIPLWLAFSFIFFVFYYFNKRAFRYFITDKSFVLKSHGFLAIMLGK
jgi:hypothetical protein